MSDTITRLTGLAETLNADLLGYDPDSIATAITDLHRLRTARQTLQAGESIIERAAAARMGHDPVTVPGVGVAQARLTAKRTKWDHDALLGAVLDHHLTTLGGELPTPWQVRDWITAAAAISYWRKSALTPLGLDPDEYCDSTPGRPTVQITASASAAGA